MYFVGLWNGHCLVLGLGLWDCGMGSVGLWERECGIVGGGLWGCGVGVGGVWRGVGGVVGSIVVGDGRGKRRGGVYAQGGGEGGEYLWHVEGE